VKTWLCTATATNGAETTKTVEADDLQTAGVLCSEWIASINGQFVSVQMVDTEIAARQAAIDKLVSSGLLTEAEATALAGG
jgi:hypothetical protein